MQQKLHKLKIETSSQFVAENVEKVAARGPHAGKGERGVGGVGVYPPSLLRNTPSSRIVCRKTPSVGTDGIRNTKLLDRFRCVIPYVMSGCLYCLR